MKLSDIHPNIETSGDLEEQFFSIQDQGMIFDILRNKMYSNPILAICREITCNARDAHREVGIYDTPIQITLPSNLEPYYKVKDFGPGISPDRISNIFIKYTASTKRNDNIQTGGFGLGAKTPFSYSDSFSIVTNHGSIQYNYSCYIDETKVGKLALISQQPTTEPNGTEIIIPVKAKNYVDFSTWTEQATRHWDIKPIFKGGKISYTVSSKILEGSHWALLEMKNWDKFSKIIIDGIEYPLDLDSLGKYADRKLIDSSKGNLVLYFGIGELSLSANREQIFLDENTKTKIKERLDEVSLEIKKSLTDKLSKIDNLWDANVFYRNELTPSFNSLHFLGKVFWKNVELNGYNPSVGCDVFSFAKGKYSHRYNYDPNKIYRSRDNALLFRKKSLLVINNSSLKEPTPRHIKKAFEDDPELETVQVVTPDKNVTLEKLNKELHFDEMGATPISNFTKAGATYTPPVFKLIMFRYFDSYGDGSMFRRTTYDETRGITNKVLCFVRERDKEDYIVLDGGKELNYRIMSNIQKSFIKTSFFGVYDKIPDDRRKKDLPDFQDMSEFIKNNISNNQNLDFVKLKFIKQQLQSIDHNAKSILNAFMGHKNLFEHIDGLCNKSCELLVSFSEIMKSDEHLLNVHELLNQEVDPKEVSKFEAKHPELNLVSMTNQMLHVYPLLTLISLYSSYNIGHHVQSIAQYINLIEARGK